jgi:hypothetical protein
VLWIALAVALIAGCVMLGHGGLTSATAGTPECADGMDNDADGRIDYNPGDPTDDFGCHSANDNSESPEPECADGEDNDGDGKIDGFDFSCSKGGGFHPRHDNEAAPAACADEMDDDFDGKVDGDDPGCASRLDNSEEPDDSDADGLVDRKDNCPEAANASQKDGDHDGVGNACDSCPRIPASRPNGCPSIDRSVSIDYSRGAFRGRVHARKAGCVKNQGVTAWRKVGHIGGGDDVQLGDGPTDKQGHYAVSYPRAPGKYYAQAESDTVPSAGNCKSARSAVLTLK